MHTLNAHYGVTVIAPSTNNGNNITFQKIFILSSRRLLPFIKVSFFGLCVLVIKSSQRTKQSVYLRNYVSRSTIAFLNGLDHHRYKY